MMMRKLPSIVAPSIIALSIGSVMIACGERDRDPGEPAPLREISTQSALTTANQNLRTMLTGSAHASVFADDSGVLKQIGSGSSSCDTAIAPPPDGSGGTTTTCGPSLNYESTADSMSSDAETRALNDRFVEVSDSTSVTIRIPPEQLCESSSSSDAPAPGTTPPPTTTTDPTCISAFTQVPVRLTLTSRGENDVDIAVLIGEQRANPLTLGLHHDELSIEIDLAAAKAAIIEILNAMGEDTSEIPDTMIGRVRLALHKNAENDFTITFGVLSAVHIASTGADAYDVQIAQANPAVSVRLDGNAQQITSDVAYGAFNATLPLKLLQGSSVTTCTIDASGNETCTSEPPPSGTIGISLAGMTASSVISAADDVLRVTNFGIGDAPFAMTIDGAPLFALDFNPTAGRKADFTFEDLGDALSMKVTPKLEVLASYDFRNATGRFSDIQSWMLDEDLSIVVDGAAEPQIAIRDTDLGISTSDGSGGTATTAMAQMIARVLSGTLTLTSRATGVRIAVSAGQCLLENPDDPNATEPAHPLSLLVSGVCPQ